MKFLFIHQNMPGQYVHIARHLAQVGHEVSFITQSRAAQIAGVRKLEYEPAAPFGGIAYTREFESGVANGWRWRGSANGSPATGLCRTS